MYFRTAGEYKVRKVSTKYESEAKDNVRDEVFENDNDKDEDDDDSSLEIRNESGESYEDMISILPSEPVSLKNNNNQCRFLFFNPDSKSDPNSASTLQLDQLEDLDNEVVQTETEHQVINELKIRPKTKYKVKFKVKCILLYTSDLKKYLENKKFYRGSKHDFNSNTGQLFQDI